MVSVTTLSHTGGGTWSEQVKKSLAECVNDPRPPKLRFLLIEEDVFEKGDQTAPEIQQYFNVPSLLLTDVYTKSNGYFTFEETFDSNGHLQSHNTWFRILIKMAYHTTKLTYKWYEMTFCSRWTPIQCTMLCTAIPPEFKGLILDTLSRIWTRVPPSEPYSLHVPAIEAIISMQDSSIWSIRDIIRPIEKERSVNNRGFDKFVMMHEVARHAIHSTEVFTVTIETLEAIKAQIMHLANNKLRIGQPTEVVYQIRTLIEAQIRILRNFSLRSQSNKERLQNEIALSYNVIAQRDSQIMTRLGEAARFDSAAMRTIAVVTMAFLPPTFLSAVFSMSFFDYSPGEGNEPGKWAVAEQFWIFWVVAAPITLLTPIVWVWQQKRKEKETLKLLANPVPEKVGVGV